MICPTSQTRGHDINILFSVMLFTFAHVINKVLGGLSTENYYFSFPHTDVQKLVAKSCLRGRKRKWSFPPGRREMTNLWVYVTITQYLITIWGKIYRVCILFLHSLSILPIAAIIIWCSLVIFSFSHSLH